MLKTRFYYSKVIINSGRVKIFNRKNNNNNNNDSERFKKINKVKK